MSKGEKLEIDKLAVWIGHAEWVTRQVDDMAQGDLYVALDPELRGHIAIATQHLQMAQGMLALMTEARS
ncbi:MAG: hypothetical protein IPM07_30945 [Anaerolineales bacterium]|nr:hypothetical protein [Anaerolineales bacterium]